MQDIYSILLLIVVLVLAAFATSQFPDFFKLRNKDRDKKTLSDALLNNRIINAFSGAKYVVISILEHNNGTFDLRVRTTGWPRNDETLLNIHPDDLKIDKLYHLRTGKGNYRYFPRNVIDVSTTPTPSSITEQEITQEYTNAELKLMLDRTVMEKTNLEGEISTLRAMRQDDVKSRIEDAKDINASRYNPGS